MPEGTSSKSSKSAGATCVDDPWYCERGHYREKRGGDCVKGDWWCEENAGPGPQRWRKDSADGKCVLDYKPPCGFGGYMDAGGKCRAFQKDAKPKPAPEPDRAPEPKPKPEPKPEPKPTKGEDPPKPKKEKDTPPLAHMKKEVRKEVGKIQDKFGELADAVEFVEDRSIREGIEEATKGVEKALIGFIGPLIGEK